MTNASTHILFVDDEQDILDVAREFFEIKGYKVFTASDGHEAIKIMDAHTIDCCFTDINMPKMDGLQLAEHLHQNDNTIPVVIMTGNPSLDNALQTLKNGVVDFLIKPIKLNQLEICLQRVLRERQLYIDNVLLTKELEGKARLEQLNQELSSKVEELYTLNKIMSEFTTARRSEDIFDLVVETALDVTSAEASSFYLINDAVEKPIALVSRTTPSFGGPPSQHADAIEGVIEEVLQDDLPLLIPADSATQQHGAKPGALMVVPLKIRNRVFGVLTATLCNGRREFTERELYYLSFLTNKAAYAIENLALYENIYENLFSTLYAFVKAIEARDPYTQQHSTRVTEIAIAMGREIGCTAEEIDILNFAGLLHDIGKIGIRDEILLKPGPLTGEEYRKIKEHPAIGARILEQLGLWDREREIIRCHHEWFDGSGYPDGLQGDRIPLLARVLAVADVYDAVASDRAYRKRMAEDKILSIINAGAGSQFDPDVVKVFLELYAQGRILMPDDPDASGGNQ